MTADARAVASGPPARGRWSPWTFGSGADVAAVFGALLALVSLVAWLSLGVQVRRLVGARGLLPVEDFARAVRDAGGVSWFQLPTIFLWARSDAALVAGTIVGGALSVAALLGRGRRLCFALSTALYLSYAVACRTFLSFQWDNLLLECGLLAALLPANRPAPVAHFLFRALLFKLYFESGIAKWQSPLGDWQDGSAMTFYYETAPLPTALAYYAHNLPAWWHHFESRATLFVELGLPVAIFGPRRARLAAAVGFTAFQLVNLATANYGFFCYLALALHVFLLDERDVARLGRFAWPRRAPRATPPPTPTANDGDAEPLAAGVRVLGRVGAVAGVALYLGVSLAQALFAFGGDEPGPVLRALAAPLEHLDTFRLVNTYHLFASITRERVEPELETLAGRDPLTRDVAPDDVPDDAWVAHDLWHKPGDPRRAPDFVAPHQPRLDFQLWFHGLGFERGRPAYLQVLLERMCEDAVAVRAFFRDPPPSHPRAVRVVYWQYHFTTPAEKRATGAWWRRERVGVAPALRCTTAP